MYLVQVSLFLGQQGLVDFFRFRHLLPLLSVHNYTQLVISRNEKLSSQSYKITGAPKRFQKWPCPLFRPNTNHTCHQKPNPSRETVPLIPARAKHVPSNKPNVMQDVSLHLWLCFILFTGVYTRNWIWLQPERWTWRPSAMYFFA